jgi:hypothetical protein
VTRRRNPCLFVGCPRSGTTLLPRVLTAHPELAIIPESHWMPAWFEKQGRQGRSGRITRELVQTLLESARFTRRKVGWRLPERRP